jgi:type I restriction enzyme S subunit
MKAGWVTKRLGDVTTKIGSGATPLGGEEAYKESGICLIRSLNVHDWGFKEAKLAHIDDVQASRLSNVLVEANDVLLNITGASVARCCLAPPEFLPARVNQHVSIIRPAKDHLSPAFLHYLLISKTYKDRLLNTGEEGGSTRQAITKAQIQAFFIDYPESLPEQQRIVGILDEAFHGIATAKANAEKNLQNARALFESHLQAVFTQRGAGWRVKTVSELVSEGALFKPFDGNHGEIHPKKADYVKAGVPFIMASDLQNGEVDTQHCKFLSRRRADSLRVGFAKDGDVLLSHKATIGRSAILATDHEYVMLTPQVTAYRVKDESRLFNRFVRYYFMSPIFQADMIAGAEGGATRAYIGITRQLTLRFRFPSLDAQKLIAAEFDRFTPETQRLESIYRQKLAALDALKKSLLDQAFTGLL